MRVLDKTVQMNEDFKPVLLITLELPLTLSGGFYMKGKDFMDTFYEAIKFYEDQCMADQKNAKIIRNAIKDGL